MDGSIFDIVKGKRQHQVDQGTVQPYKILNEEQQNNGINPFYIIEDHPNDKYRFAILRSTENGKYVRGGMLYFNFNGIDIYTDIDNAIFVDMINKSIYIKEYKKVKEEITPTDPEQRQYILMLTSYEDDDNRYTWEAITGRNNAYYWITDNIDDRVIDPQKSFVLTENVPFRDALSVANFIRYIKNAELVEPDGFDIEEYIY